MTTLPHDLVAPRDIPAVHATISPSATLRCERRALYQLAVELLGHSELRALRPEVLDSPLARYHIGAALAGANDLAASALVGLSTMSAATCGEWRLPVASRDEANALLAPALDTLRAELGRQRAASGSPVLLTEADGQRFTTALALLDEGIALAHSVSPGLAEDLFPHIALIGMIDPQHAGRLGSASPREFPGLVLIRGPRSALEVAEALIHEGAHQKLFDLAITHDLLNARSDSCPLCHPPWASPDRRWPLEQVLAAWHTYICLTRFSHDVGAAAQAHRCGPESLLPAAARRSEILGDWLLAKGAYLGEDALLLLDGLIGRRPHISRARSFSDQAGIDFVIDTPMELRRCGSSGRVLVGRPSRPPTLYWVSDDAAMVLDLLAQSRPNEIAHTVAKRWQLPQFEATARLTTLLADLHRSGLVTARETAPRPAHQHEASSISRG